MICLCVGSKFQGLKRWDKLGGSKDPFPIGAYFLYPTYLFIPPFEPPENWAEKKEKQLLEAYAGHASPATVNNTVARVTNTNFRGGCTVLSETPSQQIVPTSGPKLYTANRYLHSCMWIFFSETTRIDFPNFLLLMRWMLDVDFCISAVLWLGIQGFEYRTPGTRG